MEIFVEIIMGILSAVIGYLLGSCSTGVIVSKFYGRIDIRNYGSGNTGMTNVMRTLGWVPSLLTFAGDVLKGVLSAWIGKMLCGEVGMCVGGLFSIIGHNWPVFFHFRGGKGMSTSFGYILFVNWPVALMLLGVQLIVLLISGYMSLASIVSAVALPVLALFYCEGWLFPVTAFILAIMALYAHRSNMGRLIKGEENKLNFKKITAVSRSSVEKIKNRRKHKHDENVSGS